MEFQVERVHAAVRVRKALSDQGSEEKNDPSTAVVTVTSGSADGDTIAIRSRSGKGMVEFSLDAAFGENSTQDDVYKYVSPMVNGVSQGINTTVFAYGQTGTGKTFTMLGEGLEEQLLRSGNLSAQHESPSLTRFNSGWGVIPRAVASLFDSLSAAAGFTGGQRHVEVVCSYMQIYQDRLYDLLTDGKMQHPLQVREAPGPEGSSDERSAARGKRPVDSGVYVQGLSQFRVASLGDVLALLHRGASNRAVRATEYNLHSSRSHAILQLGVEIEVLAADSQAPTPRPHSRDLSKNSNVSSMSSSGSSSSSSSSSNSSSNSTSESTTPAMGNASRQNSSQSRHRPGTGTRAASSEPWNNNKQSSRQSTPHLNKSRPESVSASNNGSSGASGGVVELRRAKLSLIDLAGSEKWGEGAYASDKGGHALSRELTAINSSLSALGNCIAALADRRRKHVPFRDSALTRLLQDSLGGNCRTLVLATVSPQLANLEETASTIAFATRATAVTARLRPNQMVSDTVLLAKAQREISALKKSLVLSKSAEAAAIAHGAKQLSPLPLENSTSPTGASSSSSPANSAEVTAQQRAALASRERLEAEVASLRGHVEFLEAELRRKADALHRGAVANGASDMDEEVNADAAAVLNNPSPPESNATEQHNAAVKLQSLQRRRGATKLSQARKSVRYAEDPVVQHQDLAQKTEQHEAAIKVQSMQRRRDAARQVRAKRSSQAERTEEQHEAAGKLQNLQRRRMASKELRARRVTKSLALASEPVRASSSERASPHDIEASPPQSAVYGSHSSRPSTVSRLDFSRVSSAQGPSDNAQHDLQYDNHNFAASAVHAATEVLDSTNGGTQNKNAQSAATLTDIRDEADATTTKATNCYARALYEWHGEEAGDLSLKVGQLVNVHDRNASGWWGGKIVPYKPPQKVLTPRGRKRPLPKVPGASTQHQSPQMMSPTSSVDSMSSCESPSVLRGEITASPPGLFPCHYVEVLDARGLAMHFPGFDEALLNGHQRSAVSSAQPSAPMMSSPPPVPLVAPSLTANDSLRKREECGSQSASAAELDAAADAGKRAAARDNAAPSSGELGANTVGQATSAEDDFGDDASIQAVVHARSTSRSARRREHAGIDGNAHGSSASPSLSVKSGGSGYERGARSPKLRLRRRIVGGESDESVSSNSDNFNEEEKVNELHELQRSSHHDEVSSQRSSNRARGIASSDIGASNTVGEVHAQIKTQSPRVRFSQTGGTELEQQKQQSPKVKSPYAIASSHGALAATAPVAHAPDISPIRSPQRPVASTTEPKKSSAPPSPAAAYAHSQKDFPTVASPAPTHASPSPSPSAKTSPKPALSPEDIVRRSEARRARGDGIRARGAAFVDPKAASAATGIEEVGRGSNHINGSFHVGKKNTGQGLSNAGAELSRDETRREAARRVEAATNARRQDVAMVKAALHGDREHEAKFNSNHDRVSPFSDTGGGMSSSHHASPHQALAVEAAISSTLRALREGAEASALQAARKPVTSSSPSSPGYHTSSSSSGSPLSKSTGKGAALMNSTSWHAAMWRGDVEGTGTLASHVALERLVRKVLAVSSDVVSPQALRTLFDHLTLGKPPNSSGGKELPLASLVRAMVRAGPTPTAKTSPPRGSALGAVAQVAPQSNATTSASSTSENLRVQESDKSKKERNSGGKGPSTKDQRPQQRKPPSRESLQKLSAATDAYAGSKHRSSSLDTEYSKKPGAAPVRDQRPHLEQTRRNTTANENLFPPVSAAASKAAKAALNSTHGAARGSGGAAPTHRQQGKGGAAGGGKNQATSKKSRTSKGNDGVHDKLLPTSKPSSSKVKALPAMPGAQKSVASSSSKKSVDKEGSRTAAKSRTSSSSSSSSVGRSSRESPFKSKTTTPQQKQAGSSGKKKSKEEPSSADKSSSNITWLDDDDVGNKTADDSDARSQLQRKLVHALAEAESDSNEGKKHSPVAAPSSSSLSSSPAAAPSSSSKKSSPLVALPTNARHSQQQEISPAVAGNNSSSSNSSNERNVSRVSPPRPEPKRQVPSPSQQHMQPLEQQQQQQQPYAPPPATGGESRCTRHGIASCVLCSLSYAQPHQPQVSARPSFGNTPATTTTTMALPPARGAVAVTSTSTGLLPSSLPYSAPMASNCERHGLAQCVLCSGFLNQPVEPSPQPPPLQNYASSSSFSANKYGSSSSNRNYYSTANFVVPQAYQGGLSSVPSSVGILAPVPYSSHSAYGSSGPLSNGSGFGPGSKTASGAVGPSAVGTYRDGVATTSALATASSSSSCQRHGLANCFLCTLNAPNTTQPSIGFASSSLGSNSGLGNGLVRSSVNHTEQFSGDTVASSKQSSMGTAPATLVNNSPSRSTGNAMEHTSGNNDGSDVKDANNSGDESSEANEEEYLKVSIAARQRERNAKNAQLQPAAVTPSPYNTVAPVVVAAGSGGRRQRKQQQQQQPHKKPKASSGKVSAHHHHSPSSDRAPRNSSESSSPNAAESGVASEALRAARSVLITSEVPG